MPNYYDDWNKVKKQLSLLETPFPSFNKGEIWWVSIGQNLGDEVYGKGELFSRPVLILRKLNKGFFIGVPLSSRVHEGKYRVVLCFQGKEISAFISQVRAFSSKRLSSKLGEVSESDYETVLTSVVELLKFSPPSKRGSRG